VCLTKIDKSSNRVRVNVATLQPASRIPLVLRQIPIWNGELIAGFVDLALERAFVYREHMASEVIDLNGGDLDREKDARFSMLEKLADHDDALMEQLLEDIQPPRDAVFDDLARELREGQICPVLLGAASRENGVLRLMKALRHEAPGVAETAARLGANADKNKADKNALACVIKTTHLQHGGKLSLARVLVGKLDDGATVQSSGGGSGRVSGILAANGASDSKRPTAEAGEVVALGKLDAVKTGDTLSTAKTAPASLIEVIPAAPVLAIALAAPDRKDDVKLGQALLRLTEEDPSLMVVHNADTHQIVLWGQARCICASRSNGCRIATASAPIRTRPRSVIRRPFANRSPSAAATRNNPAVMASSAMWCWRSSRCRAVAVSHSRRRLSAARCHATTSARSRKASRIACCTGRSVFR
jgi:elongation factor G